MIPLMMIMMRVFQFIPILNCQNDVDARLHNICFNDDTEDDDYVNGDDCAGDDNE